MLARALAVLLVSAAVALSACSSGTESPTATPTQFRRATPTPETEATPTTSAPVTATPEVLTVPPPPAAVPEGPLDQRLADELTEVMRVLFVEDDPLRMAGIDRIRDLGRAEDVRVAWVLVDALRFLPQFDLRAQALREAFMELTGATLPDVWWVRGSNVLLSWDLPAPPGYLQWKRVAFESIDDRWAPFFDDTEAEFDYRYVSWGGVQIDDRSVAAARAGILCLTCIPALHHPAVTDASTGRWYPDQAIVFGVVINGEARAYPKHIMEAHEMVTDTLGGRVFGMPYCTLCGSAQAYFVDEPPSGFEPFELRTSGLLSRSNKVMFDLHTSSAFDTFTGRAVSGPLREAGVQLEQLSVVASTWGDWKQAHPDTTIVAQDGGIGRAYSPDPLRGRDDFGPIFPVGDIDPRLPVQELVLGVEADDGVRIAFPAVAARIALEAGEAVELAGVTVFADGSGLRAANEAGRELVSHQAFWFAWSQFWPETLLWTGR